MSTESFPISSTLMSHTYSTTEGNQFQIVVEDEVVATYPQGSKLKITCTRSEYHVETLDTFPQDRTLVTLTAEDTVLSIHYTVQNRIGLGTEDYRDCFRMHSFSLVECTLLYIEVNSITLSSITFGSSTEQMVNCYSVTSDC